MSAPLKTPDFTAAAAPPRAGERRRDSSALATLLFALNVGVALAIGWQHRDDGTIDPAAGIGYALGIAGSALLALTLAYPLRKRIGFMHGWGRAAGWLRVHMVLGVAGPLAILYHADFRFGPPGSSIALAAMLLVVASGVIGRFLYGKIHHGLYGRRLTLDDLHRAIESSHRNHSLQFPRAAPVLKRLEALHVEIDRFPSGAVAGALRLLTIGCRCRESRRTAARMLRRIMVEEGQVQEWSPKIRQARHKAGLRYLRRHTAVVRKAAARAYCQRLFSIWHTLHLPLVLVLVVAAAAHVIVVHR